MIERCTSKIWLENFNCIATIYVLEISGVHYEADQKRPPLYTLYALHYIHAHAEAARASKQKKQKKKKSRTSQRITGTMFKGSIKPHAEAATPTKHRQKSS